MATQYSYGEAHSTPETEYQAEQLQKRLMYKMANFAQIRFKRAMQLRMSVTENLK